MSDMKLIRFSRGYLWFWAAVAGIFFTYVNWYGGKDAHYGGWNDFTHFVWLSVPQSIVLLIPVLLVGFITSKRYGGFKSAMGRALFFLSLGVLSWAVVGNGIFFLKQLNEHGGSVPYPWWSDVGYVGLLPLYGLGLYFLASLVGVRGKDYLKLAWVPLLVGAFTYWLTLPLPNSWHGKEWVLTSWDGFTKDPSFFGFNGSMASVVYLLMDVVILTWAVIILINSRKIAGGVFLPAVGLVTFSLVAQYLGDLLFDQRIISAKHPYFTGDIASIMYAASMYTMAFALIRFAEAERNIAATMEAAMAAAMADMAVLPPEGEAPVADAVDGAADADARIDGDRTSDAS
ncbi:MAG: hypothetical protein H7123_03740, partial [Thermoleophilia bacterium]|nr:hypothetical protein [Thermoleophilia bacterium]